jgi:hypothetical protein
MSHDELIAKIDTIDTWLSIGTVHKDLVFGMARIIRVVAELHKPKWIDNEWICPLCNPDNASFIPRPCETIQAIERELQ